MNQSIKYKEKFIAYIDVLGFRKFVEKSEKGEGMALTEIVEIQKILKSDVYVQEIKKLGSTICPASQHLSLDLDFKVSQISDCVIVSAEVSSTGCINLISHCWKIVFELLQKGIMCRGYISKGTIYHSDDRFIGSGYHKAYDNEKNVKAFSRVADDKGTPFVELDSLVCDFIKGCEDKCVQEMFSRLIKYDGQVGAIFPFQRLSHSFLLGGLGTSFDPERELASNTNLRLMIQKMKENIVSFVDTSNRDAVRKSEHYIKALDDQLSMCDKTAEFINSFGGLKERKERGSHQNGD